MKKLLSLTLALAMLLTLAACGKAPEEATQPSATVENTQPAPSTEQTTLPTEQTGPVAAENGASQLLNAIWNAIPEEERYFVGGGDYDNTADGQAGVVLDPEYMTGQLHLPEDLTGQVSEAASLFHGMNLNSMTTAAYGLAEGTDTAAFAEALRSGIQQTRWICGFPEELLIASVDGYVLCSFGLTDNVAAIKSQLLALYPNAEILAEEAIAG